MGERVSARVTASQRGEVSLGGESPIASPLGLRVALVCLLLLTVIQQAPLVYASVYAEVRLALYVGFGGLVCILLFAARGGMPPLLRKGVSALAYFAGVLLVAGLLGSFGAGDLLMLHSVPLAILFCSSRIAMSTRDLRVLLLLYVSAATLVSMLLSIGVGGQILEQYAVNSKNQIGPILWIAFLVAVSLVMDRELGNGWRLGVGVMAMVLFSNALVVRNRSGLVAVLIVLAVMALVKGRSAPRGRVFIACVIGAWVLLFLGVLGLLSEIGDAVWRAFTANYSVGDLDSLSAGRIEGYAEAFEFFFSNPFFGQMAADEHLVHVPHNYILYILVRLGLVGGAAFLWLYVLLARNVTCLVFRRTSDIAALAGFVGMFSLIVSFFEYTYPYGPGTSQALLWMLLGQAAQRSRSVPDSS